MPGSTVASAVDSPVHPEATADLTCITNTAAKDHSMTVPSQDDLDVADALGSQLVRFYRAMAKTKSYLSKTGPDGIERAAYAILFYLVNNGPQRTSALADALHSDISTVSRQSSTLVQHGLVERTADPEDGRATLLAPTGEGQRVFEENRKLRARWIASMLQEWPRGDRVAVASLLDRLNAEMEQFQESLAEPHPTEPHPDEAAPGGGAGSDSSDNTDAGAGGADTDADTCGSGGDIRGGEGSERGSERRGAAAGEPS